MGLKLLNPFETPLAITDNAIYWLKNVGKRNPARSGSITENIIDTGGIRKVVLETNSSSDIEAGEGHDGPSTGGNSKANNSTLSLNNGHSQRPVMHEGDMEGEQVKKKNKRRRKRKNHAAETSWGVQYKLC